MGLRNNDTIAHEFLRLMGNKEIKKVAQTQTHHDSYEGTVEDSDTQDVSALSISSMSDDELSDLFIKESDRVDDDKKTVLDDAIQEHLSLASDQLTLDRRAREIMTGLEKISKSLTAKGEFFAADVVSATAVGIEKDFKKEASINKKIHTTLSKMASNFENIGDFFAADLVKTTLNKIT